MTAIVERLSDEDLGRDGGEEGWNVAQAIGHDLRCPGGPVHSPRRRPPRVSGRRTPRGSCPASRAPRTPTGPTLLHAIARSQRIIERSARTVAGHETDPCPLDHPLVGQLRCGEWLVFAGVHDLMHLEQLHAIMRA